MSRLSTESHRPFRLSFESLQFSPRYGVDVPLSAVVEGVAASGCPLIGIDIWSVEASRHHETTDDRLARMLSDAGLTCSHVSALSLTSDRAVDLRNASRLAELAVALDAHTCVAAYSPDLADAEVPDVLDTLAQCADILDAANVRLAIEILPYSLLRTVARAEAVCAEIGWDRAGILLDSWHILVSGELEASRRLRGGHVALVQLNDAHLPLGRSLTDATRNYRLLPGAGNLDLAGFVSMLRQSSYTGVVASEVLSIEVRAGDVHGHARDVLAAMQDVLRVTASDEGFKQSFCP